MTCLEKLARANRWRIRVGQKVGNKQLPTELDSHDADGFNGCFLVPLEGELWFVVISDNAGFRHASVSNAQKKILPSWTVLSRIKDAFWGDDDWCVQYFPAKEAYVNDCEWCLHIWQPLNEELPKPSIVMV